MALRWLPFALLVALASASVHAAAQGGATITVTIVDLPPGPAQVSAGATHSVAFTVQVTGSGFQCTSQGTINIGLAITNAGQAPAGVSPTVDPANVTISVPPGAYGLPDPLPIGRPLNASGSAQLRVVTTAASAGNFAPSVTASWAGGTLGQGCVGEPPAAQDTKAHQIQIQGSSNGNQSGPGPTPPGPGTGTGNQTGNMTGEPPPASRGLPGFEPLLLAGAGAVAVLARRRR